MRGLSGDMIRRFLKVGLSAGYWVVQEPFRRLSSTERGCVIFCYHDVQASNRGLFARQLDALVRVCRPVALSECATAAPGEHCVAITFDDAFVGVYENALPELAARGIPSTIFVPTGYMGQYPRWPGFRMSDRPDLLIMDKEQLLSLSPELVSVGSHSVTHQNLQQVPEATARWELTQSRNDLEALLGRAVTLFAYPYGADTPQLAQWAREAGYTHVFTLLPRLMRPGGDPFTVGRLNACSCDWWLEYQLKMRGAYQWMALVTQGKQTLQGASRTGVKRTRNMVISPRSAKGLAAGYSAAVDSLNPAQWTECVSRFSDATIYQTWACERVRWGERCISHLVLRHLGEVVAAAQVRVVKAPLLPIGVAYVYRGPMWRLAGGAFDPDAACQMLRALQAEYAVRRGLVLRVSPNEAVDEESGPRLREMMQEAGFEVRADVKPYQTFLLELSPSLEQLRRGLRHQWRTSLNKAEKRNWEVSYGVSDELYGQFVEVYREMHARKAFLQRVDVEEFAKIQHLLPDNQKMQVMVCGLEGRRVAAGVCSVIGDTAIQLFLATSQRALEVQGAFKLFWEQIRLLKEQGVRRYDIGGVDAELNPGGFRFKAGLSGALVSYIGTYETCGSAVAARPVQAVEWMRERLVRRPASASAVASANDEADKRDDTGNRTA